MNHITLFGSGYSLKATLFPYNDLNTRRIPRLHDNDGTEGSIMECHKRYHRLNKRRFGENRQSQISFFTILAHSQESHLWTFVLHESHL